MRNYDPRNNLITKQMFLALIDSMTNDSGLDSSEIAVVNQLADMWKEHILSGKFFDDFCSQSLWGQRFPLENNWRDFHFVMYFDVDYLINIVQKRKIYYFAKQLQEISDIIHHTDMPETYWNNESLATPIIAVPMLTNNNNRICSYEIIDGNHRVSHALRNGMNVPIYLLDVCCLPPQVFMDSDSFIIYNLIYGFYALGGRCISNPKLYLGIMRRFLNEYLPIQSKKDHIVL